jgi:hypothetical protein
MTEINCGQSEDVTVPFVGYGNTIGQIQTVTEPLIEVRKKTLSKLRRNYRIGNNSHVLSTANFKRHSIGVTNRPHNRRIASGIFYTCLRDSLRQNW